MSTARVFLKRIREFHSVNAKHPELFDGCCIERLEKRFGNFSVMQDKWLLFIGVGDVIGNHLAHQRLG